MALLFVLVILILGYRYVMAIPSERIVLKRSVGWEAYVYLGMHGFVFFIKSLVLSVVSLVLIFISIKIFPFIDKQIAFDYFKQFLTYNIYDINLSLIVVFALSFYSCESHIKYNKKNWLDNLKQYDNILNLTLQSLDTNTPVKVILKSRKVYVGILQIEQFERIDLDNIVLIPYLSGYRDKDTLDINFTCNYVSEYKKNNIIEYEFVENDHSLTEVQHLSLKDFRIVIKTNEIESIRLYHAKIF